MYLCFLWLELRRSLHYVRENKNAPSEMNSSQCAFFTRIYPAPHLHPYWRGPKKIQTPRKSKLFGKSLTIPSWHSTCNFEPKTILISIVIYYHFSILFTGYANQFWLSSVFKLFMQKKQHCNVRFCCYHWSQLLIPVLTLLFYALDFCSS